MDKAAPLRILNVSMVNARHLEPPTVVRTVGVSVVEKSAACEDGGGFEKVVWRVRVNDGWFRLDQLLRRRTVGWVSVELCDEDDPYGEASQGWSDLPSRVWWKREAYVVAPVGTRFWRREWRPNRERARTNPWLVSVPYDKYDKEYELRGEGWLVPLDVLAEERRHKTARESSRAEPLTSEEVVRNVGAILAMLAKKD